MVINFLDIIFSQRRKSKSPQTQQIKETVEELKKLVDSSTAKDSPSKIQMGHYHRGHYTSADFGRLYLTSEGLQEITGGMSCSPPASDICGMSSKYEEDPKIVDSSDFERLVVEYSLLKGNLVALSQAVS